MKHPPLAARACQGVCLVWLTAILLLGWALRTHDLEVRSLWEDEGWTMLLSAGPGLDDVVRTLADDQHPPLLFHAAATMADGGRRQRVRRSLPGRAGRRDRRGRHLSTGTGVVLPSGGHAGRSVAGSGRPAH